MITACETLRDMAQRRALSGAEVAGKIVSQERLRCGFSNIEALSAVAHVERTTIWRAAAAAGNTSDKTWILLAVALKLPPQFLVYVKNEDLESIRSLAPELRPDLFRQTIQDLTGAAPPTRRRRAVGDG